MANTDFTRVEYVPGAGNISGGVVFSEEVQSPPNVLVATVDNDTTAPSYVWYQSITNGGSGFENHQVDVKSIPENGAGTDNDQMAMLLCVGCQGVTGNDDRYEFRQNLSTDNSIINLAGQNLNYLEIVRVVGGVDTVLIRMPRILLPGGNKLWRRWRFQKFTDGAGVRLRVEFAPDPFTTFTTALETEDTDAARIVSPGEIRVGGRATGPASFFNGALFDDILVDSLS